ncbi:MAG: DNA-directed RNA polymerase subunit omega [Actinomycetota bacterium]|jgi:DNA-directed RNA polymerase subunit omega|nr:DNA-directed RNA polymerase subunit omega [Actinomycetota bacterium]
MPDPRSTMIEPPIEDLLDKVDSKFTLVTLASKRARQINSYFNQLGEGLGAIVPPQVASIARKPLSIALEEIAASKVRAGAPQQLNDPGYESPEEPDAGVALNVVVDAGDGAASDGVGASAEVEPD